MQTRSQEWKVHEPTLIWVTNLSIQGTLFSAVNMRRALHCSSSCLPVGAACPAVSEA